MERSRKSSSQPKLGTGVERVSLMLVLNFFSGTEVSGYGSMVNI